MPILSKPCLRVRTCRAACALVTGCASCAASAAWQLDVDEGFLYDSNLTRAYAPRD